MCKFKKAITILIVNIATKCAGESCIELLLALMNELATKNTEVDDLNTRLAFARHETRFLKESSFQERRRREELEKELILYKQYYVRLLRELDYKTYEADALRKASTWILYQMKQLEAIIRHQKRAIEELSNSIAFQKEKIEKLRHITALMDQELKKRHGQSDVKIVIKI